MVEGLLQSLRTLHNAWTNVQVELHGQYSHERLSELHSYSVKASWTRIMLWFVITPIPVLVYNALLDLAPLAEPSAGRDANWVFWIRCLFTLVPMTLSMFSQFALLMPELGMGRYHVIFTSIVATTVCLAYNYIIAGYIRMPIPFIFIAGSPAFATTTGVIFAAFFGKKMLRDNDLRIKFNSTMTFITTQLSLTIVYPLFVFGFNSVTPTYQTIYMILAPFLKIAAKNVMSKLIGRLDDFKPAILIFVVDMFHALYISLVMQKATTASTSLFILMIDSVQLCVSIYDVYEAYAPLKTMMKKIPTNHPLREQNFLEIAVVIQDITAARRVTGVEGNIEVLTKRRLPSIFPKPQKVKVKKGSVAPAISNVAPSSSSSYNHLGQFITDKERACFLSSAKRLLFTIEFIMLTEYAEVIVPIFYSFYMAVEYRLPNRRFYSVMDGVDEAKLHAMVTSVLEYALLELLSLCVLDYIVQRITRVQPMWQVGFALRTQCWLVQSMLFAGTLYALQSSLAHLGADYSFQFKWLQHS